MKQTSERLHMELEVLASRQQKTKKDQRRNLFHDEAIRNLKMQGIMLFQLFLSDHTRLQLLSLGFKPLVEKIPRKFVWEKNYTWISWFLLFDWFLAFTGYDQLFQILDG